MTTAFSSSEYGMLLEIEGWLAINQTSQQHASTLDELASRLQIQDFPYLASKEQIRKQFNSVLLAGFDDLAFSSFLHKHGSKIVEELEILGTITSVYALMVQMKEIYDQYQEGSTVKEIAENEISSMVRKAVSAITPIPYVGPLLGIAAERITDRYQYGYKFTKKKSEIADSMEDLLTHMREQNFVVDRIVR